MNLSNPKTLKGTAPAKSNPFKVGMEKFWAVVSLISTMVPGATTRDNISAKNIGVVFFVLLVTYLGVCGLIQNVQWLGAIRITGEWFYYLGIAITSFVSIEFLNTEKKVREFAIDKKLIYPNKNSVLEDMIGRNSAYNVFSMIMEAIGFFWVIAGIIFYDRFLFIGLMAISIAFAVIENTACKKTSHAKAVIIAESLISIAGLLYILLNHYLS